MTNYFDKIDGTVDFDYWFFGHYHSNENLPGGKEHLIYEQVVRID